MSDTSNIRQFYLVNNYGDVYDLNDPLYGTNISNLTDPVSYRKAFLYLPEGLGFSMDKEYVKIGNSFITTKSEPAQGEISGSLLFGSSSPYIQEGYFLEYIRNSKKLKFKYVNARGSFYRNVEISTYEKGEINTNSILEIKINFSATSSWYSINEQHFYIQHRENTDKNYTYREDSEGNIIYAYQYPYTYKDYEGGTCQINNTGSFEAPFTLIMNGPIVSPKMCLLVDGVEKYRIDFPVEELQSNEKILWSSVDGDLYCYLVDANGTTNLGPSLSLENANFFKLPIGISTIKIEATGPVTSDIIGTFNIYYNGV